jgi:hypothetical protein
VRREAPDPRSAGGPRVTDVPPASVGWQRPPLAPARPRRRPRLPVTELLAGVVSAVTLSGLLWLLPGVAPGAGPGAGDAGVPATTTLPATPAPTPRPTADVAGTDPPDLARYPGSVRTRHERSASGRLEAATIEYLALATTDEVRDHYRRELRAHGWFVGDVSTDGLDWRFQANRGTREATIDIVPDDGVATVSVAISDLRPPPPARSTPRPKATATPGDRPRATPRPVVDREPARSRPGRGSGGRDDDDDDERDDDSDDSTDDSDGSPPAAGPGMHRATDSTAGSRGSGPVMRRATDVTAGSVDPVARRMIRPPASRPTADAGRLMRPAHGARA